MTTQKNRYLLQPQGSQDTTLTSTKGRHYRVQVSVREAPPPKDGYPVLYVLDGNGWFGPAVDVARMREYEKLSPTIVVGIATGRQVILRRVPQLRFHAPGFRVDPDFRRHPPGRRG